MVMQAACASLTTLANFQAAGSHLDELQVNAFRRLAIICHVWRQAVCAAAQQLFALCKHAVAVGLCQGRFPQLVDVDPAVPFL